MKNMYLNTGTINEVFSGLETSFNGVLNSSDNEFKLALNTDLIKANIEAVTFINGITSIQVNLMFSDDVTLSMESLSATSIVFAYCTEGSFKHSFGISGHQSTLRKHLSTVVTSKRSINTILHFKKDTAVQFSIIKVETANLSNTINDPLISNLKKTFLDKQPNYSYQGIQNMRIAEKLQQLIAVSEHGMVGHIMKKEIIQSIIAMEVDDNTDTIIRMSRAIKRSTLHKINELKKISGLIKQYTFDAVYSKVINSKNRIFIK
ncbi:hypothetical protein [Flavobacterium caseinilyticum]|uniref:AraC family transcriptional regulator n=1 Tax=Flavobacterium caseinilyticum TaxID=2541732 RepID=A0A4R5AZZ0_9FLAO|nr:hypothetical protein [Flavobacterium caseinilyticum]TDD77416.1 hypothetical protein E0F89_07450 [Flavobacterium caseinilyticum]